MIVVLMGYMGSGKSTIGKELATILNYKFLDLDDYIAAQEGMSVSNLFESKGEIYFRRIESVYLKELLKDNTDVVIGLGGGTPCYGQNLELLLSQSNVKLIYLKLSIPLLTERLFEERKNRPLISYLDSKADLLEFVGKHLFERVAYYNKAHFTIDTAHKTKQDIIELVLMKLI